ncbi:M4 family peptidase [Pseudonocardiaceae bacterium YIM PH 21723]|nr:M4 family peptidase [Pseudonocardiaceae bacterium YIM PH 21723]
MRLPRILLASALVLGFQVTDSQAATAAELRTVSTIGLPDGGTIVRQQQYIDGVPVLGGQLVRSRDTVLGKITGGVPAGGFPAGGESSAGRTAAARFPGTAASVDRVWFDPALAGLPGAAGPQPAYRVTMAGAEDRTTAIVLAADNSIPFFWSLRHDAQNRLVCDANRQRFNTVDSDSYKCGTKVPVTRNETGAESTVGDVNAVHGFFGDTVTTYAKLGYDLTSEIGADYGDGNGKALRATVRGCSTSSCPYTNAFWDGEQMFFGEGVTTDDVAAHELTHGVTQHNSNLTYASESGAINEALSDIFGEFTDLTNDSADDTPANRWKIGEGSSLGVIRDMADPESKDDPGTYKGKNWKSTINLGPLNDNGGVHSNSGVANKLAFLIADGGTYNGVTNTGVGLEKSLHLWWITQLSLTSTSNYKDLGKAINAGCSRYAQSGTAGITTADCTEVAKAVKAVKIG